jgi:hypothetical protein
MVTCHAPCSSIVEIASFLLVFLLPFLFFHDACGHFLTLTGLHVVLCSPFYTFLTCNFASSSSFATSLWLPHSQLRCGFLTRNFALAHEQALFQQGQLEPVALGMVCSALVRAGRLRSGVEIINSAMRFMQERNQRPSVQVSIIHSILSSIPMKCVAEEDAARAFVEGLVSIAGCCMFVFVCLCVFVCL